MAVDLNSCAQYYWFTIWVILIDLSITVVIFPIEATHMLSWSFATWVGNRTRYTSVLVFVARIHSAMVTIFAITVITRTYALRTSIVYRTELAVITWRTVWGGFIEAGCSHTTILGAGIVVITIKIDGAVPAIRVLLINQAIAIVV